MTVRPLIVFDVNETLLDLRTMEPIFERIFGEKNAMRLWFANLVMYSVALTLADSYVPFTDIGSAVMTMLADTQHQDCGRRQKGACREVFNDAAAPGRAGSVTQAPRCGFSVIHPHEQPS